MRNVRPCGVWVKLGTLRWQMHLTGAHTGFQIVLGKQPCSTDPLLYLLDRTKFSVPACAARQCAAHHAVMCEECVLLSGLGGTACQTNVCSRTPAIGSFEPSGTCPSSSVSNFGRVPGDPSFDFYPSEPHYECRR